MTNTEIWEMYSKGYSVHKIVVEHWSDLKKLDPKTGKKESEKAVCRVIYEKIMTGCGRKDNESSM